MSKNRRKKNRQISPEGLQARRELKESLKKFNWKRFLLIVVTSIIAYAVFVIVQDIEVTHYFSSHPIAFELDYKAIPIIYYVYYSTVTVLIIAILILNRGLSRKDLTPDMFEPSVDRNEVQRICDRVNRQKKIAKKLMLVLLPFLIAILIDFVVVFFGDTFTNMFSSSVNK